MIWLERRSFKAFEVYTKEAGELVLPYNIFCLGAFILHTSCNFFHLHRTKSETFHKFLYQLRTNPQFSREDRTPLNI